MPAPQSATQSPQVLEPATPDARAARAKVAPLLLALALVAATALAAWLRLPDLALRPMHGDEAVHADKFNVLWSSGRYQYDPREYHGPTLYFFAWPLVQMSGAQSYAALSEATLRLAPALFGIALIPLLWLVRDGLDTLDRRPGAERDQGGAQHRAWLAWAALLCAASPVFVFYSRYFIQEMLLVFWSFAAIACAWRFQAEHRRAWLVGAGLSVGLMLATKETAVIVLLCAGPAALVARWKFPLRDFVLAAGVAVATALLCYTSFGRNPSGALDALSAAGVYLSRANGGEAQGALHQFPPGQYFEWLLWFERGKGGPHWSEWSIALLAIVGSMVAVRRWRGEHGPSWTRFAVVYTLSMALLYALIPYKTPWCALGFWHGAIWLAGIGAASLARGAWWRQAAFGAAILAMSWDLASQARAGALDERLMLNRNNPWVYAHPTMQARKLGDELQVLAEASGQGSAMTLAVVAPGGDYWPIPFYARFLQRIGYFDAVPAGLAAARPPVVIASAEAAGEVTQALGASYVSDFFGLRRGIVMSVFTRKDVDAKRAKLEAEKSKAQAKSP